MEAEIKYSKGSVLRLEKKRWKVFSLEGTIKKTLGFPGGAVVENLPANAGDTGSSPGPGRSHMPWSKLGP